MSIKGFHKVSGKFTRSFTPFSLNLLKPLILASSQGASTPTSLTGVAVVKTVWNLTGTKQSVLLVPHISTSAHRAIASMQTNCPALKKIHAGGLQSLYLLFHILSN